MRSRKDKIDTPMIAVLTVQGRVLAASIFLPLFFTFLPSSLPHPPSARASSRNMHNRLNRMKQYQYYRDHP